MKHNKTINVISCLLEIIPFTNSIFLILKFDDMTSAIARIMHKLINPDEPISPHVNEIIENSFFNFFYNTKTVCYKHPEKIHTNSEII
jgi:hypothetical protein